MSETNRPQPDAQGAEPTPPGEVSDALPHDQRRARRPNTAVLLTRSRHRVLGGVIGGVAGYVDTDPHRLRLIVAVLTVVTGGVLALVYGLLWLLLPTAP